MRGHALRISPLLFIAAACASNESTGGGFNQVTTTVDFQGDGGGEVRYAIDPAVPRVCTPVPPGGQPTDLIGKCRIVFEDAGGGGSFDLEAVPDAGSVFGAWTGCTSTNGTICTLGFDNAPETFDVAVRFDAAVPNSCPSIVVPGKNTLGLKAGPRPGPATPVPDDPAAWAGTNYLVDPGFEGQLAFAGGIPTSTGYWAFDEAWSAPTGQQGINARSGGRMLHFVSSSRDGTQTDVGTASEQIQLVDVSALRTRIDAIATGGPGVSVSGRAYFNRVASGGCTRIDNAFGIRVSAHNGIPTDVNVALGFVEERVTANDDPADWQQGLVGLLLPAGTTHVAVRIFINEGTANNDATYPEFHGHYADDVVLVVQQPL